MASPKDAREIGPESGETMVVVFDGSRAQFFRYLPNGRLEALKETSSGLHHDNRQTVSDKPGRSFASAGGGVRHSLEPKHDPHKMEKHNFVHSIAADLDLGYEQGKFKRLAIVAPERSLGELRKLMSDKLRKVVWREVPKELAQFSDHELMIRLGPYFAPEKHTPEPGR